MCFVAMIWLYRIRRRILIGRRRRLRVRRRRSSRRFGWSAPTSSYGLRWIHRWWRRSFGRRLGSRRRSRVIGSRIIAASRLTLLVSSTLCLAGRRAHRRRGARGWRGGLHRHRRSPSVGVCGLGGVDLYHGLGLRHHLASVIFCRWVLRRWLAGRRRRRPRRRRESMWFELRSPLGRGWMGYAWGLGPTWAGASGAYPRTWPVALAFVFLSRRGLVRRRFHRHRHRRFLRHRLGRCRPRHRHVGRTRRP